MLSFDVKKILKQKKLSVYWLGQQTGISINAIYDICNGKTKLIKFDTIEKICIALECTPNDIIVSDNPQLQRLLTYQSKLSGLSNKDE